MYRDNSLIPSEAIRLLALGLLAEAPRSYAEVAAEVRRFIGLVVGPSLDLVAPPLELLKIEGLVRAEAAGSSSHDAILHLTDAGRAELQKLLAANVRAPTNDISKLILALKMRFLPQMPLNGQRLQAEILAEVTLRERARLKELRSTAGENPIFAAWLDLEIAQAEARLQWFERLSEGF